MEVYIRLTTNDLPEYEQMKVKEILQIAREVVWTGMQTHTKSNVFKEGQVTVSAVPLR